MMLAIILGIIKFILLLLLTLLGLIVALLLLILLVPVRYRAEGSYHGSLKGTAGVSWLLHIVSCRVSYAGEAVVTVRVFGIPVGRRRKGEPEAEDGPVIHGPAGEAKATGHGPAGVTGPAERGGGEPAGETGPAERGGGEPAGKAKAADGRPASDRAHPSGAAGRNQDEAKAKTRPHPFPKIKVTISGICDKLRAWKGRKDEVLAFARREENRRTFRLLKKQAVLLLKHILPGKLQGHLKFGFDDPSVTGRALMYVSPFCGFYAKHLTLVPVFGEPCLEADLKLKGRIRAATLIAAVVRVWMDKNFRSLVKKWREA